MRPKSFSKCIPQIKTQKKYSRKTEILQQSTRAIPKISKTIFVGFKKSKQKKSMTFLISTKKKNQKMEFFSAPRISKMRKAEILIKWSMKMSP